MKYKIFLTFDCEDFINDRSVTALYCILKLLNKYDLKGLFFITGHMAEKISNFPKILSLLEGGEIGYHSSAHSVRPSIIEYTDVEKFEIAREISLDRETKHIDPLTGETKGRGGILFLRDLFPNHQIVSYRAPAFSYSPPVIEALKELGIKYDFSTRFSQKPIKYKDITYYPYPVLFDNIKYLSNVSIYRSLIKNNLSVFDFHPNVFVNQEYWDSIYFMGNPKKLHLIRGRSVLETQHFLSKFELLLKILSDLKSIGFLEITPVLKNGEKVASFNIERIIKVYQDSVRWSKTYLKYKPTFTYKQFMDYLSCNNSSKDP